MPKLTSISWQKFVQRMRELGFKGPYAGGRHPYMRRDEVKNEPICFRIF
jgi:hypothetical protein